jgi:hypothetical protein
MARERVELLAIRSQGKIIKLVGNYYHLYRFVAKNMSMTTSKWGMMLDG